MFLRLGGLTRSTFVGKLGHSGNGLMTEVTQAKEIIHGAHFIIMSVFEVVE